MKPLSYTKKLSKCSRYYKGWVIISVQCSADNNRTVWCMTKADENEHLKQSMKAVNCLLVLKNIFKVCFELPSAVSDDCEAYEEVEREQTQSIFWLTALLSSTALFPHLCVRKNYSMKEKVPYRLSWKGLVHGHIHITALSIPPQYTSSNLYLFYKYFYSISDF